MKLRYRPASPEDVEILLIWRNDPDTFKYFFNPNPVTKEEHYAWFHEMLTSKDKSIFIAEIDGKAAGVLRVDRKGDESELSWTVAPETRGQGVGKAMLIEARAMLRGVLTARIIPKNLASLSVARSAGFACIREDEGFHLYRSVE